MDAIPQALSAVFLSAGIDKVTQSIYRNWGYKISQKGSSLYAAMNNSQREDAADTVIKVVYKSGW